MSAIPATPRPAHPPPPCPPRARLGAGRKKWKRTGEKTARLLDAFKATSAEKRGGVKVTKSTAPKTFKRLSPHQARAAKFAKQQKDQLVQQRFVAGDRDGGF